MNDHDRPALTIPEIAQRWHKHPTSVRRALDSRRSPLIGYKSPETSSGQWLILTSSVYARWGAPPDAQRPV
jgi:hypothetical protein